MMHLSFHPGLNGLAMVLMAILSAVLVALFYRQAYSALQHREWLWLYSLRMIAIGIVLLLLFRPVLQYQREMTDQRLLVVLVDTSGSMRVADETGGLARLDQATSRLQDWLGKLRDSFEIQLMTFSSSTNHLEHSEQLDKLEASGEATSLSRALTAAQQAAPTDRIEAALLLSDGIHNSAGDPVEVAGQLAFPVHTIGTGASLRDRQSYRDLRITGLECPDQLFINNRARLTGYIDATGFPGRVVHAVLRDGDHEVAEQELILDDVDGPQEVTFEFTPTVKGLHTYTIGIPPIPEERISENNQRSASTQVIDARIRVLYLEGTLRAEYGAMVGRFLSKDPVLEFCALVQTRPNHFMQRTNIEDLRLDRIPEDPELLSTFDVFLIGDLDHSYFGDEALVRICQRVREGAGLLMMGGYHSLGPGGYADTPLDKILPVFLGDREVGQCTEPFLPILTPDGQRHPIFANIADFFPTTSHAASVENLPPLEGCVRILGAKPGGTVLAVHPNETAPDSPMPIMVVQPVDQGRAAVFTGDTTRNWHQTLRAMDQVSPFLRFWGQAIRWLAGRSEEVGTEAGIAASTDKSFYEPESEIRISATVQGPEGEGVEQANVHATIRLEEGGVFTRTIHLKAGPDSRRGSSQSRSVSLAMDPVTGPAGHYQATFIPQDSGRYEIEVKAEFGETTLKADPLSIEVGRPYLEFDRLDLDDAMLVAIANKTAGRYSHITTADRLIDRLVARQQARLVQYELSLAPPSLLWIIFVIVLTTEWLLRKKYQLR
ncbi:MAG: VWA domain-containing protein [Pirellulales bacterium]|nr:VWA domain-containing protein [Pirellulales bacterium]